MAALSAGRGRRGTARALAGCAACAALLFASCATGAPPAGKAGLVQAAPAGSASVAAGEARPADRRPRQSPYLLASLASIERERLASGVVLLARRLPGRGVAAAELLLLRDGSTPSGKDGVEALALSLAARGGRLPSGGRADLPALVRAAGGSLELKALSEDALALELAAPLDRLPALLEALAASVAAPSFEEADFVAAMRDLRAARLAAEADPARVAAEGLRTEAYRGSPYARPPFGTAESLAALRLEDAAAYWREAVGAERVALVVAGDLGAAELAARVGPALAALPRKGGAAGLLPEPGSAPAIRSRPESAALASARSPAPRAPLSAEPPSPAARAHLRAAFPAPPPSSPDYAALSLALVMLDDLLKEELLGEKALAGEAAAWLAAAAAPSGFLAAEGAASAAKARAGMERALAALASGECAAIADPAGGRAPFAESLDAYRARALVRLFGREGSAAAVAAGMARDLASGGDGTGPARLADGLAAVGPADLERVVREYLDPRRLAWFVVAPKSDPAGAGKTP